MNHLPNYSTYSSSMQARDANPILLYQQSYGILATVSRAVAQHQSLYIARTHKQLD